MRKSGFTLVELAIVLVIIGLLIGGVLTGQELIDQAKIRSATEDITTYNAAVNTFRSKYQELPGDLSRATSFGVDRPKGQGTGAINVSGTNGGDTNGDGDSELEDSSDAQADLDGEIANFWVHLSNTTLIQSSTTQVQGCTVTAGTCNNSSGTAYPLAPLGNGVLAITEEKTLHYLMGVASSISDDGFSSPGEGSDIVADTLSPEEAFGIDSKLDDGKPESGAIQVYADFDGNFISDSSPGPADCFVTAGGEYNLIEEGIVCSIFIKAST